MVTLLRRLFVKNYRDVEDEKVRIAHGKLGAWFGIITNLLIAGGKLTIAILLAANNNWILPMALLGDAINNFSDMGSSMVTLIGFKISAKPADSDHPFGHQRIEYIAGLIVSSLVIALAVTLLKDSITKVIENGTSDYDMVAMIVLGASILLKLFQGYVNFGLSRAIDSPTLKATAIDSFTDCIATGLILVSAILTATVGWSFLDGYMGIALSLFVMYSGIKMIKETADPLIGQAADKEYVNKIVHKVTSVPEIKGVHDVICHNYGPKKYFISLHAEVDHNSSIDDVHSIIDDIEESIKKEFGCDITIHMDPIVIGDPEIDALRKGVGSVIISYGEHISFHDFRIVKCKEKTNVIFDVVIPFESKITKERLIADLDKEFADKGWRYCFVINVDRPMHR